MTSLQPKFSLSNPPSFMSFMGVDPESTSQNTSIHQRPSQDLLPGETDLSHHGLCFKFKPNPCKAFMQKDDKVRLTVSEEPSGS